MCYLFDINIQSGRCIYIYNIKIYIKYMTVI